MAKRNLRMDGDPILRKKSKPITEVTENILKLLDDMKDTMNDKEGVGLAAVQVGSLRRIVIIDIGEKGDGLIEMINPEMVTSDGEQQSSEACLSIPGYSGHVDRPMNVTVKYFDRHMKEQTIEASEFLAVAICHEMDHLDGILFTDKGYDLEIEEDDEKQPKQQGKNRKRSRGA